ncbi:MAG: ATP-binding protein [Bacillota bacterium]|nr:ATP-binding protein [Bacillota bacterium]
MAKSLKGKISLIYLSLVLITAIVGSACVINLFDLNKSINGLMTANYKSINAISNALEANNRQDSDILVYLSIDKQKGIDSFLQNNDVFMKWFNVEKNNVTELGESNLVNNAGKYYSDYLKSFMELQDIRNTQGIAKATVYYNLTVTSNFSKLKDELKALSQLNEKAMFSGKEKANQNSKRSMYIILIITSAAIIGGFLTSRFFTNRFLKPIDSLTKTIKLVKAGDLNQQAPITSQDEIGELANEFNNMTSRLLQFEKSALGSIMSEKNRSISIVRNISDPLIVLDKSYKILILNTASESFFDILEEKTKGKHFLEIIRNGELFDHISSEFGKGEDRKEKIINIISNNTTYYLNVVVSAVKDISNNLTGYIVLFQNVTELKELEKTRTDFIATISHEFKTPLTSIMMGTDLLMNEGMGDLTNDQKSIAYAIKEDCDRLSSLVNDVMELTKLESGKAIFNLKPCSIVGIVENAYKQFKPIADQKNVSLEFDADEDLPFVAADFEKITWVLNNLISNALKYTNAGDDIFISAAVKDKKMYISVKDTGIGIPEEYKENIFDRFFQVKGNDLEIRGTGLGLSVAKEIIEAHGGKIWCDSRLDLGSTFSFTLNLIK